MGWRDRRGESKGKGSAGGGSGVSGFVPISPPPVGRVSVDSVSKGCVSGTIDVDWPWLIGGPWRGYLIPERFLHGFSCLCKLRLSVEEATVEGAGVWR